MMPPGDAMPTDEHKGDFQGSVVSARQPLLTIHNRLRCCFAQFKLCANFLHDRNQSFNLLLLPCKSRLEISALLLDFAVLFQELVKQHRIHQVIPNAGVKFCGLGITSAEISFCNRLENSIKKQQTS